jgi:2,3,4,5-tetrahydropyridine-2-carboxylate N-succinyltransferase
LKPSVNPPDRTAPPHICYTLLGRRTAAFDNLEIPMTGLKEIIEDAFERRQEIDLRQPDAELKNAILTAIEWLDTGEARVAEKTADGWVVNQWLKKAVLLYFGVNQSRTIDAGYTKYYDKVPLKFEGTTPEEFERAGIRVVPNAVARKGAYIASEVVLMPSYVNIGAYVDSGTLVDTWATVGSCAQIGKNVHLSGGVGIGGVLEPIQANPTIIEDNCFIGARSEIVEGVIVEQGAVISMGVFIGQSTRIYDREADEVSYGRVPAGAVVVPGSLPSGKGDCSLYCAVIVKKVDAQTREKVAINELLRAD